MVQGLPPKKHINSGLRSRSPTPSSAAQSGVDLFELGGLRDEDLEESYPVIKEIEGLRKTARGNEACLAHCLVETLTSIPTSL